MMEVVNTSEMLLNKKTLFKAALKTYLNIISFYYADEFLCLKLTCNAFKSTSSLYCKTYLLECMCVHAHVYVDFV
jgi:hypothetical protein